MSRLKEFYNAVVVPELMKQFAYKSIMEVPRVEKITLNDESCLPVRAR